MSLTPAPGCQDHTTSPSTPAELVQRLDHVHRSPLLRIVTTRTPLFDEAGCGSIAWFLEIRNRFFFTVQDHRVALKTPAHFMFGSHILSSSCATGLSSPSDRAAISDRSD